MMKGTGSLAAFAIAVAILTGAQPPAQAQSMAACSPGAQLIPAGRDGAGNPVAAYCAEAPRQGVYDPYTGPNVLDPQATVTGGGPGQFIPKTR
jgi:hypothetical protein